MQIKRPKVCSLCITTIYFSYVFLSNSAEDSVKILFKSRRDNTFGSIFISNSGRKGYKEIRYSTPSPTSGFHIREAINNILCINTHKKLFCLFPFFPFLGAEKREREKLASVRM